MAGAFSASSSHGEPVTEHQGLAQEAEKLGNRLKEGGKVVAFRRAKSETLLACAWPVPPPPSHGVGAAPCPQSVLGWALQKKKDLLRKAHLLGSALW